MVPWQRTLYILVFVQLVSAIGFSGIFPFLPLYIEDLGTTSGLSVEFMSGLVFSAQAFTMMLTAPIWGALADRHGRKLMVARATLGGSVIILLMAFVQSAEQLVLLRAIQGMITGVFAALTALAAASVPRDRMGYALGTLQVGLWGGVSIGPLIGGVVADAFGYSAAFYVTAAMLFIAGLLTLWGVHEDFEPVQRERAQSLGMVAAWRHVLSMPGVPLTYTCRFLSRLGRTMVFPFAPLFVKELLSGGGNVATITGLLTGASALAGTFGAIYLGRMGDRVGHRRILVMTALAAALLYVPQSLVVAVWQLFALQLLAGGAGGGIMPTISALLAGYTDPGEEGAVFGLESSIMAAARTVAPLFGAALVSWFGLRSVFVATGFMFLVLAVLAQTRLPARAQPAQAVPTQDPVAAK
ncbi:MAG: multidrug efflux MFS transporter [Chloroflexi bacterium]|nr:multidrug efflux MFS transporter [Chloroflexota bacterium]